MKLFIVGLFAAAILSSEERVSICHIPPGQYLGRVIEVPAGALAAHLNHGDFLSLTCE